MIAIKSSIDTLKYIAYYCDEMQITVFSPALNLLIRQSNIFFVNSS